MHSIKFLPVVMLGIALSLAAYAQSASQKPGADAEGKHVFRKANCFGCHKWDGSGGGGYGGDALSLRATKLDREQITTTVKCGRPGTGMPYHMRGAYDDPAKPCYGLSRQEAGRQIPPEPTTYLRPHEIEAVVSYVIDHIKGKGPTTYADCTAFWGDTSRVCDVYKGAAKSGG
jgi:mono/diheme cytochrome c family protein